MSGVPWRGQTPQYSIDTVGGEVRNTMPNRKYTKAADRVMECSYCHGEFNGSMYQFFHFRKGDNVYCTDEHRYTAAKLRPKPARKPKTREDLLARFLKHVKRLDNGCLECDLPRVRGYPMIKVGGKTKRITHVAWFLQHGEWPPKGMQLDHICHDPNICKLSVNCPHRRCAEYSHLDMVTPKEHSRPGRNNVAEATRARKAAQTHCKHGHELTDDNTYYDPTHNSRSCRICRRESSRNYHHRKSLKHGREQQTGNATI